MGSKGQPVEVVRQDAPEKRNALIALASRESIEPIPEELDYDISAIEQRLSEMELYGGDTTPKLLTDFGQLKDWMRDNDLEIRREASNTSKLTSGGRVSAATGESST